MKGIDDMVNILARMLGFDDPVKKEEKKEEKKEDRNIEMPRRRRERSLRDLRRMRDMRRGREPPRKEQENEE